MGDGSRIRAWVVYFHGYKPMKSWCHLCAHMHSGSSPLNLVGAYSTEASLIVLSYLFEILPNAVWGDLLVFFTSGTVLKLTLSYFTACSLLADKSRKEGLELALSTDGVVVERFGCTERQSSCSRVETYG